MSCVPIKKYLQKKGNSLSETILSPSCKSKRPFWRKIKIYQLLCKNTLLSIQGRRQKKSNNMQDSSPGPLDFVMCDVQRCNNSCICESDKVRLARSCRIVTWDNEKSMTPSTKLISSANFYLSCTLTLSSSRNLLFLAYSVKSRLKPVFAIVPLPAKFCLFQFFSRGFLSDTCLKFEPRHHFFIFCFEARKYRNTICCYHSKKFAK